MPDADAPSWLPTLDDLSPTHVLELPAADADFLRLPARPGVVVFEGDDGRPLLIATTADLRELARRRLGSPEGTASGESSPTGPRADHRAITRRVLAIEVGSSLEADVVYLAQARRRMPDMHRIVSERWRAWFVQVNPDAPIPLWSRTSLAASSPAGRGMGEPLESGATLGPLADKEAAGRLIDLAVDAFDLCRDESLLVQAPRARACPYKEMGRCPAPCDGSEPLPSYRLRTRRAVETITGGMASMREKLAADMAAAAARTEFELAAELKQQVQRLAALAAPAFAHVADLRTWSAVFVLPAARPKRARALVLAGGRLGVLDEVDLPAGIDGLRALADRAMGAAASACPFTPEPATLDTLAATTRWLYTASSRRRGVYLRIQTGDDAAALGARLAEAMPSLVRSRTIPVPDQEIGG